MEDQSRDSTGGLIRPGFLLLPFPLPESLGARQLKLIPAGPSIISPPPPSLTVGGDAIAY